MAARRLTLTRRAALGALALPALAQAQNRLPWETDRPIRLIHNGGAGSGSDAVTRVLALGLSAALNAPIEPPRFGVFRM